MKKANKEIQAIKANESNEDPDNEETTVINRVTTRGRGRQQKKLL